MSVPYTFANRRDSINLSELDANFAAVDTGGGGGGTWGSITGTLSNQTDLQNALDAKATTAALTAHTGNTSNPHSTTAAQVGLGNVDNTSDATKNAATATLTNKTVNLSNNTLTGTTAQFNTALSDGDFATLAGTETLTNKTIGSTGLSFDIVSAPPAWAEGKVFYDNIDHTIAYYNDASGVTVNLGQEMLLRVRNNTGSTLTDGQVVYVNGAVGNRPTVALAKADAEATSEGTIGVVTNAIANNADGYITTFGLVHGLNTNAYAEGTILYLSAETDGAWTSTAPVAPQNAVKVAYVTRQHLTLGSIFVKVDNGFELSELHDVKITSVAAGNFLQWDVAGYWKNTTGPTGAIVGTTDSQTLTNKSVDMASNTLTGTSAQFNTACSDAGFVFRDTASGIFGYTTGMGGTVTQVTSKSTAVTLNKSTGQITMNNAALAANTAVKFTVNNSLVSTTDTVVVNPSGSLSGNYTCAVQGIGTGYFNIRVANVSAGALSDALVINFSVTKGAIS